VQFGLLILVTGILLIRPTDLNEGLAAVPLYNIAIIGCILVSFDRLSRQLRSLTLRNSPRRRSHGRLAGRVRDLESGQWPIRIQFQFRGSNMPNVSCSCSWLLAS